MKIIKPAEISSKIMTLIDEAESELIIVSPYNKISGWVKLKIRIEKAIKRGVSITWYSRKNDVTNANSDEVINNLGIYPKLIDDLHAKVYLNEREAIVSSMNLHFSSDQKSIDIGYITESQSEYDEILNLVQTHIIKPFERSFINRDILSKPIVVTPNNSHIDMSFLGKSHFQAINNYVQGVSKNCRTEVIMKDTLQYSNFIKEDYWLRFLFSCRSIRILIIPPKSIQIKKIEQSIYKSEIRNSDRKKLLLKDELSFRIEDNIIQYHYISNFIIEEWGPKHLQFFLDDLALFVKVVI